MRENPATSFIARTLAEHADDPWNELPQFVRTEWMEQASNLIIAMYAAGFTIPQPREPDAIWASLKGAEAK